MKVSSFVIGSAALRCAWAWGAFGHTTVGYVATNFVDSSTKAYLQDLMRNTSGDYLAGVATWADSIRYTKWGAFSSEFHFIDAKDEVEVEPLSCNVDYERDCKKSGCIVSAIQNYTEQLLDVDLVYWRRVQAVKFLVHFLGDIHQPLHNENYGRGGNDILVDFDGERVKLHHVWDSNIPEKIVGGVAKNP
jgi:hypothetical protein